MIRFDMKIICLHTNSFWTFNDYVDSIKFFNDHLFDYCIQIQLLFKLLFFTKHNKRATSFIHIFLQC